MKVMHITLTLSVLDHDRADDSPEENLEVERAVAEVFEDLPEGAGGDLQALANKTVQALAAPIRTARRRQQEQSQTEG